MSVSNKICAYQKRHNARCIKDEHLARYQSINYPISCFKTTFKLHYFQPFELYFFTWAIKVISKNRKQEYKQCINWPNINKFSTFVIKNAYKLGIYYSLSLKLAKEKEQNNVVTNYNFEFFAELLSMFELEVV